MVRKKKAERKYGMVTVYLRAEYKEQFNLFLDVIEEDNRLIALRKKAKDGLISIAFTQFFLRYLDENPDLVDIVSNRGRRLNTIESESVSETNISDNNITNNNILEKENGTKISD